jgi:nitrogenase molybdenum-iron protein NifN
MLGQARFAIAAEADLLNAFSHLFREMGAEVVAAVVPSRVPILDQIPVAQIKIGDLEDLEELARQRGAEVVIGSSHAAESARRLGLPLLRAGFPLYDRLGAYQRTWIGYQGTRQLLFELANILLTHGQHEDSIYHSWYSQKFDSRQEAADHGLTEASLDTRWQH